MNKKYMDFVPSKSRQTETKKQSAESELKRSAVDRPERAATSGLRQSSRVEQSSRTLSGRPNRVEQADWVVSSGRPRRAEPKRRNRGFDEDYLLGTIEELSVADLASTEDLSGIYAKEQGLRSRDELAAAKAKKVGGIHSGATKRGANETRSGNVRKNTTKRGATATFRPPKAQFINQDKVVKRPLSKNVYQKKVVTPKEEPKGPVTIITKPEKQPKVNLIVTIILTIILGAAAGTIAFLLLPK